MASAAFVGVAPGAPPLPAGASPPAGCCCCCCCCCCSVGNCCAPEEAAATAAALAAPPAGCTYAPGRVVAPPTPLPLLLAGSAGALPDRWRGVLPLLGLLPPSSGRVCVESCGRKAGQGGNLSFGVRRPYNKKRAGWSSGCALWLCHKNEKKATPELEDREQ